MSFRRFRDAGIGTIWRWRLKLGRLEVYWKRTSLLDATESVQLGHPGHTP